MINDIRKQFQEETGLIFTIVIWKDVEHINPAYTRWLENKIDSLEHQQEVVPHDTVVMWRSVDEEIPSLKQPVLMAVKCGSELKVEQGEYIGNDEWINCWFSKRGRNTYPVQFWKPLDKPKAI